MKAIGLQDKLDTGSFLERYAVPGGPMWTISSGQTLRETLSGGFEKRMTALERSLLQKGVRRSSCLTALIRSAGWQAYSARKPVIYKLNFE
jgi:hypothetical protein